MNEIKNLSRKSARPATIATKNHKQTMSLTTMSTEDGMYKKFYKGVSKKLYKIFVVYRCMKNESNVKRGVIYVLYIGIVIYLDLVIYLNCYIFGSVREF